MFTELKLKAEQLNGQSDVFRTLDQIAARSEKLAKRGTQTSNPVSIDDRAQALLSDWGFSSETLKADLEHLDVTRTLRTIDFGDSLDTHLDEQHNNLVWTTLEASKEQTRIDVLEHIQKSLSQSWSGIRHKMGAELPLMQPKPTVEKLDGYVPVIRNIVLNQEKESILGQMSRVPLQNPTLASCWQILECIIPKSAQNNYLDGLMGQTILDGAKRYIENTFYAFVDETVHRQPKMALAGGDPSVIRRVEAFVRFRFKKYNKWDIPFVELINNEPCWCILYFLLRCGKYLDAVNYASTIKFHVSDDFFPEYLKSWNKKAMNSELIYAVRSYYIELNECDPYKKAVYKIIGKCDQNNKRINGIINATEDWLWIRMMMADSIFDVQLDVLAIEDNDKPKYFCMLMCCGMFEYGINFLYKEFQVEALHFALSLHHYGCLRIQENLDTWELDQTEVIKQNITNKQKCLELLSKAEFTVPLHFMLSAHIRNLDHEKRLFYILRYPNYFHFDKKYIMWLQLAEKHMAQWIRDCPINQPLEVPEYVYQILNTNQIQFQKTIVLSAAELALSEDQIENAIFLFAQADEPKKLFETLCKLISRVFLQGPQFLQKSNEEIRQMCLSLVQNPMLTTVPSPELKTASLLLEMLRLKTNINSSESWFIIESLGLLPLCDTDISGCFSQVSRLDPNVTNCLSSLLRITMETAIAEFNRIKDLRYVYAAQSVARFAGLIPFKLDSDVHAFMAQSCVLLDKLARQ